MAAPSLAGAVIVLTPDALDADLDAWTLDDADAVLWGDETDQAGASVRCDKDATGDGIPDLMVGAPFADGPGLEDAGTVFVIEGGRTLSSGALSERATSRWTGSAPGESLGFSVTSADLDGDGLPEWIAGAPGSDAGSDASGAIRVLSGADRATSALYVGRSAVRVDGVLASPRLGTAVAAEDLDRDGVPELIGAAWRLDRDGTRLHAGEIVGWSGALVTDQLGANASEAAFVIRGQGTHQEVGRVLVVRDIDGDGAIDIVTAARRRAN